MAVVELLLFLFVALIVGWVVNRQIRVRRALRMADRLIGIPKDLHPVIRPASQAIADRPGNADSIISELGAQIPLQHRRDVALLLYTVAAMKLGMRGQAARDYALAKSETARYPPD